jgi:hypothetical protein
MIITIIPKYAVSVCCSIRVTPSSICKSLLGERATNTSDRGWFGDFNSPIGLQFARSCCCSIRTLYWCIRTVLIVPTGGRSRREGVTSNYNDYCFTFYVPYRYPVYSFATKKELPSSRQSLRPSRSAFGINFSSTYFSASVLTSPAPSYRPTLGLAHSHSSEPSTKQRAMTTARTTIIPVRYSRTTAHLDRKLVGPRL